MVHALAVALAGGLVGAHLSLDAGVRAEARGTGLAPRGAETVTRGSADLTPRAALVVEAPPTFARVYYESRLSAPDVEARAEPTVTHRADLRLEHRPRDPIVLGATALAIRGRTDPLADIWREVGSPDPTALPTASVPFQSLRAAADVAWDATRRDALSARGSWLVSGGTDAAARTLMPLQRTIALDGTYARGMSPRDVARLSVSASDTRTDPDRAAAWAIASAEWRRLLARDLEGWSAAGVSLSRESAPPTPVHGDVAPVGSLGLTRRTPARVEEVSIRTAPSVHRVDGEIRHVASASATVRWWLRPSWSLLASAIGSQAWWGARVSSAAADVRSTWRFGEHLALEAGVLGRWQDDPSAGRPPFVEGAVLVALSVETFAP